MAYFLLLWHPFIDMVSIAVWLAWQTIIKYLSTLAIHTAQILYWLAAEWSWYQNTRSHNACYSNMLLPINSNLPHLFFFLCDNIFKCFVNAWIAQTTWPIHTSYLQQTIWIWLTHWVRDKMDAISQTEFWIPFSRMKMFEFRLKFNWSLFLRVQLTIFFIGAVQATSHYLNKWCLVSRRIYASLGLNELNMSHTPTVLYSQYSYI